jgi:hypothetical protein
VLKKQRPIRASMRKVSNQFVFKERSPDEILVADSHQIMSFNYETGESSSLYVFQNYLNSQPVYCVFNKGQDKVVIATFYDVLYVDIKKDLEVDIDNLYHVGDIRSIVNFENKFYVLANKQERLLGYYLLEIDEKTPT